MFISNSCTYQNIYFHKVEPSIWRLTNSVIIYENKKCKIKEFENIHEITNRKPKKTYFFIFFYTMTFYNACKRVQLDSFKFIDSLYENEALRWRFISSVFCNTFFFCFNYCRLIFGAKVLWQFFTTGCRCHFYVCPINSIEECKHQEIQISKIEI
jgi:hypothetical protein